MNLNLIMLNTKGRVDFDEDISLDGYEHEEIKRFENIHVKGTVLDNGTEDYEVKFHLTGTMILKSAVNGSDVFFDLDINYDDFVTNLVENYKNSANSLDILPILWENILLEIPIRAVNKDDAFVSVEGEGWEILETE